MQNYLFHQRKDKLAEKKTSKDKQISLLEKLLEEARNENSKLTTERKKKKRNRKKKKNKKK